MNAGKVFDMVEPLADKVIGANWLVCIWETDLVEQLEDVVGICDDGGNDNL